MVLIEIAVAIEETWVDQVTALIERNNLLKNSSGSGCQTQEVDSQ